MPFMQGSYLAFIYFVCSLVQIVFQVGVIDVGFKLEVPFCVSMFSAEEKRSTSNQIWNPNAV